MTDVSLDVSDVYLVGNQALQLVKVQLLVPLHQDLEDDFEIDQMRLSILLEILLLLHDQSHLLY